MYTVLIDSHQASQCGSTNSNCLGFLVTIYKSNILF